MIYFADQSTWKYVKGLSGKSFIRNFMTPISLGSKLNDSLLPPMEVMKIYGLHDMEKFRQAYIAYLNSDVDAFDGIVDIVMDNYYEGNTIIITDLNNELVLNIIECVSDFIFNRYTIQPAIANTVEDLYDFFSTVDNNEIQSPQTFLYNFMHDKEIYTRRTIDPKQILKNLDEIEDYGNQ